MRCSDFIRHPIPGALQAIAMHGNRFLCAGCLVALAYVVAGCAKPAPAPVSTAGNSAAANSLPTIDPRGVTFLDEAASQPAPEIALRDLAFTTEGEEPAVLRDYGQDKHLVLVFLGGYNGAVGPYCSAQTAQLIANYQQIQARNAEVVLVYPVEHYQHGSYFNVVLNFANDINSMRSGTAAPFPILLDVGLKAVDVLGIRQDLAKPATYILDRTGAVKFAYVGNSPEDRPSVKVVLEQLRELQPETP